MVKTTMRCLTQMDKPHRQVWLRTKGCGSGCGAGLPAMVKAGPLSALGGPLYSPTPQYKLHVLIRVQRSHMVRGFAMPRHSARHPAMGLTWDHNWVVRLSAYMHCSPSTGQGRCRG